MGSVLEIASEPTLHLAIALTSAILLAIRLWFRLKLTEVQERARNERLKIVVSDSSGAKRREIVEACGELEKSYVKSAAMLRRKPGRA
jgi:hypothetical protein